MFKRAAGFLLCILLIFQMTALPARADEPLYFLAVGNEVQTVSDQTMPFWSGGYLYIPAPLFNNSTRSVLGARYRYVESEKTVILHNEDMSKLLLFSMEQNYSTDAEGKISYPGGLLRNGTPFVPAFSVAKYFGFEYSVTEVSQGQLVWLRQQNFGLTDKEFADAATYPLASKYAEYMKGKTESPPVDIPGSGTEIDGKRIYLCMAAGDDTERMLDALDRYDAQAAFFCTQEFLETRGDLLRRMAATGQSIGLLADAADADLPLEEQLARANRALQNATCGGTRLVWLQNGTEQTLQAAQNAGYRVLSPTVDHSAYNLHSAAQAATLLSRVSDYRGSVSIWLDDNAAYTGLRAFLSAAEEADAHCLAWTETA